ncbi:MAG TPA: branched-chain amino acid ABC transporter permease, partial [Acidimicrobiales bacterium]|nr:branched-chain amino acid ABC transporter permease [Acidimicrobiales bacterium]
MTEFLSLLVAGIVSGAIYAVSASGLVVTYNTTGIFNFAHGAMGMILAYLFWQCWQGWGWNVWVSLAITLLVGAPLLGAIVERAVMRPLYGASLSIRLAVTLGLLLVLVAVANIVWNPANSQYDTPNIVNGNPLTLAGITLSAGDLITVGVALAVAVFLRLFFKRTRTGVAMRAVVDDPSLAQLSGAPSGRISAYAWMIGVMFAGLGGILLVQNSQTMDITTLTVLVIYGYAAAVVGRLRSLPFTFLGAMVLGIANSMSIGYAPSGVRNDL